MKKDKTQELFIQDYKILLRKYYNDINVNKRNKGKLKGALVANLIKKYIEQIIIDYKLPYKVSGNNVYIYGYAVECDLLILKQDSKAIFEAPEIYRAEDVITIIESKATGIFIDKKKPKNPFLNELCMVKQLNDKGVGVKFAYISLAEQISGISSRLLDEANRYINEYSNEKNQNKGVYCFSKTYPEDEYPLYEGNPYSFDEYIKYLCDDFS